MIFLDNHGRLRLLGNDALGMHICMMSRKALLQLFHEVLGSLSTRMSEGRRLESRSFASGKSAWIYCQTFRWIAGLGRRPLRETVTSQFGAIGKHKINGCLR